MAITRVSGSKGNHTESECVVIIFGCVLLSDKVLFRWQAPSKPLPNSIKTLNRVDPGGAFARRRTGTTTDLKTLQISSSMPMLVLALQMRHATYTSTHAKLYVPAQLSSGTRCGYSSVAVPPPYLAPRGKRASGARLRDRWLREGTFSLPLRRYRRPPKGPQEAPTLILLATAQLGANRCGSLIIPGQSAPPGTLEGRPEAAREERRHRGHGVSAFARGIS